MKPNTMPEPGKPSVEQLLKLLQSYSEDFLNDSALHSDQAAPAVVELARMARRWMEAVAESTKNRSVLSEMKEQATAYSQLLAAIVCDGKYPEARDWLLEVASRSDYWPVIATGRMNLDEKNIHKLTATIGLGKNTPVSFRKLRRKSLGPGGFGLHVFSELRLVVVLRDNIKRLCRQEGCDTATALALKCAALTPAKRRIVARACRLGDLSKRTHRKWADDVGIPWIRATYSLPTRGTADYRKAYEAVPGFSVLLKSKSANQIKSAATAWGYLQSRVRETVKAIAP